MNDEYVQLQEPETVGNNPATSEAAPVKDVDKLEQIIPQVLLGARASFPVTIKLFEGTENEAETTLHMRWPTLDDEAQIDAFALTYSPVRWDALPAETQFMNKARATIEVLAVGPYPSWLPLTEEPVELGNGKKERRPETGKVKSRGVVMAVYQKFIQVYSTFQRMAF